MIVPNKFLRLEDTPLGKVKFIIDASPNDGEISLSDLFEKVSEKFESIEEFAYALDILFLAKRLNWISERSVIVYAD